MSNNPTPAKPKSPSFRQGLLGVAMSLCAGVAFAQPLLTAGVAEPVAVNTTLTASGSFTRQIPPESLRYDFLFIRCHGNSEATDTRFQLGATNNMVNIPNGCTRIGPPTGGATNKTGTDGTIPSDADAPTYAVTNDDRDHYVRFVFAQLNTAVPAQSAIWLSPAVRVAGAAGITISGIARIAETLTVSFTTAPTGNDLSYRWFNCQTANTNRNLSDPGSGCVEQTTIAPTLANTFNLGIDDSNTSGRYIIVQHMNDTSQVSNPVGPIAENLELSLAASFVTGTAPNYRGSTRGSTDTNDFTISWQNGTASDYTTVRVGETIIAQGMPSDAANDMECGFSVGNLVCSLVVTASEMAGEFLRSEGSKVLSVTVGQGSQETTREATVRVVRQEGNIRFLANRARVNLDVRTINMPPEPFRVTQVSAGTRIDGNTLALARGVVGYPVAIRFLDTDPDGDTVTHCRSEKVSGGSANIRVSGIAGGLCTTTGRFHVTADPAATLGDSAVIRFHARDNGNPPAEGHVEITVTVVPELALTGDTARTVNLGEAMEPIVLTTENMANPDPYDVTYELLAGTTGETELTRNLTVTPSGTNNTIATIEGTPSGSDDFTFRVKASGRGPQEVFATITITLNNGLPTSLTPAMVTCTIHTQCDVDFSGTMGVGTLNFAHESGTLPMGMTEGGGGGNNTYGGMPSEAGTFPLMVEVGTDAHGDTVVLPFSLEVEDVAISVDSDNATQMVNRGDAIMDITLASERFSGDPAFTFVEDMGGTPTARGTTLHGLTVAADTTDPARAIVSGAPMQTGTFEDMRTFTFQIRATSGMQMKDSGDITITQDATARPRLSETERTCFIDEVCDITLTAMGAENGDGMTTVAWADTSETLPSGVSLNGNVFSERANDSTQAGTSFMLTFTITEGFDNRPTTHTFTLRVENEGLETTSDLDQTVTPVANFTDITFTAVRFATPPNYVFVVDNAEMGTTLQGLTLSGDGTETATISGNPMGGTTLTTLEFVVRATVGTGAERQTADSGPISITLDPGAPPVLSSATAQCFVNVACAESVTVNGGQGEVSIRRGGDLPPTGLDVNPPETTTMERTITFRGRTAISDVLRFTFTVTEDYPDGGSFEDRVTELEFVLSVDRAALMLTSNNDIQMVTAEIDAINLTAVNFARAPTYSLVEGENGDTVLDAAIGLSVAAGSGSGSNAEPYITAVTGTPTQSVTFRVRATAGTEPDIQTVDSAPITITLVGDRAGSVRIVGAVEEGSTLTAVTTDPDKAMDCADNACVLNTADVTYRWQQADPSANDSNMPSNNWSDAPTFRESGINTSRSSVTYRINPNQSQIGKFLRVQVTYSRFGGGERLTAVTATTVANTNDPPVVTFDRVEVGAVSTVSVRDEDYTDSDGVVESTTENPIAYIWQIRTDEGESECVGTGNAGENSRTYTPEIAQAGMYLRVRVMYQDQDADIGAINACSAWRQIASVNTDDLVKTVIPDIANSITASIAYAINERVRSVVTAPSGGRGSSSGNEPVNDDPLGGTIILPRQFTIGGHSDWASFLKSHAVAGTHSGDDLKRLIGSSQFAVTTGGGAVTRPQGFWGSGSYQQIKDESGTEGVTWDGNLTGFSLGTDSVLASNVVLGAALNRQLGEFEVTKYAQKNDYEISMLSLSPYIGWSMGPVHAAASFSYGQGDGELTQSGASPSQRANTHDFTLWSGSLSGFGAIWRGKSSDLQIKADLLASNLKITPTSDQNTTEMAQTIDTGRLRFSFEGERRIGDFALIGEFGGRRDVGDTVGGSGYELGAGLRYASGDFSVSSNLRAFLSHAEQIEEYGVQVTAVVTEPSSGQGLSLRISPSYGRVASQSSTLWKHGVSAITRHSAKSATSDPYTLKLHAQLGYGFYLGATNAVLTPYFDARWGDLTETYGVGVNWRPHQRRIEIELRGERSGAQKRGVLRGSLGF